VNRLPALAVAAVLLLPLSGCAGAPAASEEGVSVVASTDVWASVAEAVGGNRIQVTAIIDSPGKDPHEYEATARDQLAVSRADLVIANGGGYDPFLGTLVDASGTEAVVLDAVEISGLAPHEDAAEHEDEPEDEHAEHDHIEGFNEHVWYHLGTAVAVAERIAGELSTFDPTGADAYAAGLADFRAAVEAVQADLDALHAVAEGRTALVTEAVPLWLLAEAGVTDLTPGEFSEAIEEGTDVSPGVLLEVLALVEDARPALLAYNEQAETGQTERVRDAAEAAGVPVIPFSETLPDGEDYAGWMEANVDRLAAVLAR
jgi:zinc/manganese transport system substrate-binding protein